MVRLNHEMVRHHRNGRPVCRPEVDFRTPAVWKEDFVYGGPLLLAFGHFIAESMHRLGPLLEGGQSPSVLFSGPQLGLQHAKIELPSYAIDLLRFAGVSVEKVRIASMPVCVDNLHIGSQGCDLGGGPKEWYLDWLDGFSKMRLDSLEIPSSPHRKIYVSRSNFIEGGFLGEQFFEQRLVDCGFHIFHPENNSITSQLRTYIDSDTLLIGEGSACHGTEFIGRSLSQVGFFNRRPPRKAKMFQATLAPRCRSFEACFSNIFLGALPVSVGPMPEHQGVTLLDWTGMQRLTDRLGINNAIRKSDVDAYLTSARFDLHRYIELRKAKVKHVSFVQTQDAIARKLLVDFDEASAFIKNEAGM